MITFKQKGSMASTTIFAVPDQSQRSSNMPNTTPRKRKRNGQLASQSRPPNDTDGERSAGSSQEQLADYTAIVTPLERSQKRLAGLPLDEEPPAIPFPHAPIAENDTRLNRTRSNHNANSSLHVQHLSAMTAILHRSMMTHDYTRASRAIGLILRNDIGGRPIDVRSEGLWGLGAEILLRRNNTLDQPGAQPQRSSRQGFERAKTYYETLVIQYPQHRTWPGAVNARDFCAAMFGLWIYVTQQECLQLQGNTDVDEGPSGMVSELRIRLWELEQGRKIAEAMDNRMQDITLKDDYELVRLRVMVALWIADLLEMCLELEDEERIQQGYDEEFEAMVDSPGNVERIRPLSSQMSQSVKSRGEEAAESRVLARSLLDRLKDGGDGSSE